MLIKAAFYICQPLSLFYRYKQLICNELYVMSSGVFIMYRRLTDRARQTGTKKPCIWLSNGVF